MQKKINLKYEHHSKSESISRVDQNGNIAALKSKKTNFLLNGTIVISLYIFSFFIAHFIKFSSIIPSESYLNLFGILSFAVFTSLFLSNKYNLTRQHELGQIFRKFYISLILSLGIVAALLYYFNVQNISRAFVISTLLVGFILESIYFYSISERRKSIRLIQQFTVSYGYILADASILTTVLYLEIVKSIGQQNLTEKHFLMVGVYYFAWFISAASTHKFNPIGNSKNRLNAAGIQIKFYLIIFSLISFSVFFLQIRDIYWIHFIEAAVTYSIFSYVMFVLLFVDKIKPKTDEVTAIFLKAYELKGPANSPVVRNQDAKFSFHSQEAVESSVKQKLQFDYLKDYKEVFEFLDKKIALKSFDSRKTFIIKSSDTYNIHVLENNSWQMIINLHELNDTRRINEYLRTVNNKLLKNGLFIGALVPNRNRHARYISKYQPLLADFLYFIDFIWKRVFPKLPLLRKFYFLFEKGKDRAISLAEGLGRLVYSGFEILDLQEIDSMIYFAVVKAREATDANDPKYSPIFKMKRIGKDGKTIYVYKFRTMHPYSEYIQDFVYKQNSLEDGGKFKDDFRIPGWGRFFRKTWIDELPMLINWVMGDLKFVGVRPISNQYLNLYSLEHQAIRKSVKPGLVPPFYADMPKTIEEIERSERVYIESYKKNPLLTDIKYLTKAAINIIFKSKRSA